MFCSVQDVWETKDTHFNYKMPLSDYSSLPISLPLFLTFSLFLSFSPSRSVSLSLLLFPSSVSQFGLGYGVKTAVMDVSCIISCIMLDRES